jgi:hypothetical protein
MFCLPVDKGHSGFADVAGSILLVIEGLGIPGSPPVKKEL